MVNDFSAELSLVHFLALMSFRCVIGFVVAEVNTCRIHLQLSCEK